MPELPHHSAQKPPSMPSVSVIIPVRSEAGNLAGLFGRLPHMGSRTELVFVEGHSTDDSAAVLSRLVKSHPEWECQLLQQTGVGKGDAVRLGLSHATGDILMILDADLSVDPEELPRFYHALVDGTGEMINGVRLLNRNLSGAMPLVNRIGNHCFGLLFSCLLKQRIKDTLCGTKAFWRCHYLDINEMLAPLGAQDPFGDFTYLLGAAGLGLTIVDMEVPYHPRRYGVSKITPWKDGLLLLKYVWQAAWRMRHFQH